MGLYGKLSEWGFTGYQQNYTESKSPINPEAKYFAWYAGNVREGDVVYIVPNTLSYK